MPVVHPHFDIFCFPQDYYYFAKIPNWTKLRFGRGGIFAKVLLKYMQPVNIVNGTFHNDTVNTFIKGILIILQDNVAVKSKEQLCIIFCHPVIKKHWDLLCESLDQGEVTRPLWEKILWEGDYSALNPVHKLHQIISNEGTPPG